jgi:hypothetical protein
MSRSHPLNRHRLRCHVACTRALGVIGLLIAASAATPAQSPQDTAAVLAAVGQSLIDTHPGLRSVGDRWRCERRADVKCDGWWSHLPAIGSLEALATSARVPLRSVRGGPSSWPACPVTGTAGQLGSDVGYGAAAVTPVFRGDTARVTIHVVCSGRTMRRDRFTVARDGDSWIVRGRQYAGRRST